MDEALPEWGMTNRMRKLTAILIGAGDRGNAYANYALSHPREIEVIAVAEPNPERRDRFKRLHRLPDEMVFTGWEEALAKPKLADVAIICTMDRMHYAPTMRALELGYHILLEKPMAVDPLECIRMAEFAEEKKRVLSICHLMRYSPFFRTVKQLLDEGRIGKLMSIQHNENVAYWHYAHSFVRGNWRNSQESSPMLLQKSCHDLDFLSWIVGAECVQVSSFGSLSHFTRENAPEGAPDRCLEGCPAELTCPYHAYRQYLSKSAYWIKEMISLDQSLEARTEALLNGPFGRCVYKCDNDVVDHQVVNLLFANGVTAMFSMNGFNVKHGRSMKIVGTKGEIRGYSEKHEIEISDFLTETTTVIKLPEAVYSHGGGDYNVMRDFVRLVWKEDLDQNQSSARASLQSHIIAFAAEKSRLEGKVVHMKEYLKEIGARASVGTV
jgi:predicted dehydrogenase